MATAQQVRSQTKQGQWSSVFPTEQVTETQSALFVKKLLAVAVSSISYLRALFPENAFGDRCLGDVNLKILRDDSTCPEACRVIQWIRGCFDALEKKYLRAVLVGIYEDPDDPDTVIEQYSFKFAYGDGTGIDIYRNGTKITTATSDKETKNATIRLLRTIVLLSQTLSPLPDDVMMTMKLLYYDDVTPEDYNPPGFKEAECDEFHFKEEPMSIKVGDVSTQYHSFKLRIKSSNHDLQDMMEEGAAEEAIVPHEGEQVDQLIDDDEAPSIYKDEEDKKKENIEKENVEAEREEKEPLQEENEEVEASFQSPEALSVSRPNTRNSTPASSMIQGEIDQSEDMVTKCCCGINEDDGLMILCAVCNTWQHATCYAVLKPEDAPESHYCVECVKSCDDYTCTDEPLAAIADMTKIKADCLWRRTLVSVLEATRILAPNLSKRLGVPVAIATSLLNRLEKEGFVKAGGKAKRFGKLVQKEEIMSRGFDKYFRYVETAENEEDEVDDVVEQASNMSLSTKKVISQGSNSNKGSKRKSTSGVAVSSKNKELRFDISDSQTSPSQSDFNVKKKRKTSVSAEPMCV